MTEGLTRKPDIKSKVVKTVLISALAATGARMAYGAVAGQSDLIPPESKPGQAEEKNQNNVSGQNNETENIQNGSMLEYVREKTSSIVLRDVSGVKRVASIQGMSCDVNPTTIKDIKFAGSDHQSCCRS